MSAQDPAPPGDGAERRGSDRPTSTGERAGEPQGSARDAPESSRPPESGEEGLWSAYWERFRRQQVDDPVPDEREGMWDRFRRQQVDDPVRRGRS